MKLLVDEMYPPALTEGLRAAGIDARSVVDLGLGGSSDVEVFAAAVADGRAVLTENVGDIARIAADHSIAGAHHDGVLIALSSRFSRRPAGRRAAAHRGDSIARARGAGRSRRLPRPPDRPVNAPGYRARS